MSSPSSASAGSATATDATTSASASSASRRVGVMMGHMSPNPTWSNKVLVIGAGVIAQSVLPLIIRYVNMNPALITVLSADNGGRSTAEGLGMRYVIQKFTKENFVSVLDGFLAPGDFLLNLSVSVGSLALMEYCQRRRILYQDASLEPWGDEFMDPNISMEDRSNYSIRNKFLELRQRLGAFKGRSTTAITSHGANPGLAESFAKQGIYEIATAVDGVAPPIPANKEEWAALCQRLGIRIIQVSERDGQQSSVPKKKGEFVQTWSVIGYIEELLQPAEMGWGTHERRLPEGALLHTTGSKSAIMLDRPSALCTVKTWCPRQGPHFGTLTTHYECLELADFLTIKDASTGRDIYRPTTYYSYHPCDDAVLSLRELAENDFIAQQKHRILLPPYILPGGYDEYGMLILGSKLGGYWYGVNISVEKVKQMLPHVRVNATTCPVTYGVIAGFRWAVAHPMSGLIEPCDMDHNEIIDFVKPFLECRGYWTDWHPLKNHNQLQKAPRDPDDPLQFSNFLVGM
ncbi:hypothetical protein Pelo_3573 [Pelomyxa schiedti]|nr:hypothetical protein Pelo_3573 [Pelomyxa schiedti]